MVAIVISLFPKQSALHKIRANKYLWKGGREGGMEGGKEGQRRRKEMGRERFEKDSSLSLTEIVSSF